MSKPDPWRLDPAAYPHRDTLQTRFGDLDVFGHINNVAMVALFETARTRFKAAAGLAAWSRPAWLIASQTVRYLAEGRYPADVEMALGVGRIGGRSWDILGTAFQDGRAIATSDVTFVLDAPALPPELRTVFEKWAINR